MGNYLAEFLVRLSHDGDKESELTVIAGIFIATKRDSHIINAFAAAITRGVCSHGEMHYACATYVCIHVDLRAQQRANRKIRALSSLLATLVH